MIVFEGGTFPGFVSHIMEMSRSASHYQPGFASGSPGTILPLGSRVRQKQICRPACDARAETTKTTMRMRPLNLPRRLIKPSPYSSPASCSGV